MIYEKTATAMIQGRPVKKTANPLNEGIIHHKLGLLSWELEDGTVVVCKSYHEYKPKQIMGENK